MLKLRIHGARVSCSCESLCACHVQVRKICCACLVKLYRKGDTLPLYARVSSLQSFLSSKEVSAARQAAVTLGKELLIIGRSVGQQHTLDRCRDGSADSHSFKLSVL